MNKGRLEAFSDGVIAVLITIMMLEFKAPNGTDLAALRPMLPDVLVYILSFVFLGIYWNNHHHLLHATTRINGKILWANLHLLFWLSLTPFVTAWMGQSYAAPVPTAIYGTVLLFNAISYSILVAAIIAEEGPKSTLAIALGKDYKGKLSLAIYAVAIPLALLSPWTAAGLYVCVAVMWFIPDRRIESKLKSKLKLKRRPAEPE